MKQMTVEPVGLESERRDYAPMTARQ